MEDVNIAYCIYYGLCLTVIAACFVAVYVLNKQRNRAFADLRVELKRLIDMTKTDQPDAKPKDKAAISLGRRGGKKGGVARAKALSPERRKEISQMGVAARRAKKKKGLNADKYPLADMQVGNSFRVPPAAAKRAATLTKTPAEAIKHTAYLWGKPHGQAFTVRAQPDGSVRVWRTK